MILFFGNEKKTSFFNTPHNYILTIAIIQVEAQVTIGSALKPNKGALLDLKQEGITTKGLGLPRVLLKEVNKLIMGTDTIVDENSAWKLHTGLLVYNTNKCLGKGGNGLYVWDGSLWQRIPKRNKYESDGLYQPNSYLVLPGTTELKISVEKAFRIWEYYGSEEGKNRLPSDSITGILTPVLYWQDAPIILSQSSLSISGNERSDMITVNLAGGRIEGNAVVALKDGNGTIRWSWHIWVTDDPTIARDLNGGGFIWMDRHLGATSATAGEIGTIGLTYQWGRKDPFPMPQSWSNAEPILQSGYGEQVTGVDKSLTNQNTAQTNFKNSISSPLSFIKATSDSGDWYNPTKSSEDAWDERWDRTEGGCLDKSPFDPCPEGWRVPSYQYDEKGNVKTSPSPWESILSNTGASENNARTWDNFGVYPFSGYRSYLTGEIANTGGSVSLSRLSAYVWSASVSIETLFKLKPFSFYYRNSTSQEASLDKAWGFSVRCVKE